MPSLRGVGTMAVESDLTEISFTSAPRTVTSPCQTRTFSVPGLAGSEKVIWLVDSSARAAPKGASARAAASSVREQALVVFIKSGG